MTDQPTEPLYKTPEIRAALEAFVRAVYAWGHYSREIHTRCADALEALARAGAATVLRDFADQGGLDAVASDPDVLACIERLDRGEPLTDDAYRRLEADLGLYVERTQAMIAAVTQAMISAPPEGPTSSLAAVPASTPEAGADAAGMFSVPPDQAPQTPTTETTPTTDPASEGPVRA